MPFKQYQQTHTHSLKKRDSLISSDKSHDLSCPPTTSAPCDSLQHLLIWTLSKSLLKGMIVLPLVYTWCMSVWGRIMPFWKAKSWSTRSASLNAALSCGHFFCACLTTAQNMDPYETMLSILTGETPYILIRNPQSLKEFPVSVYKFSPSALIKLKQ